ncbi:efflux RND transporter periplasmic adaptor subunit [Nitrospirillum viridazoti]|uniref:Multidrug efflux system membrane fusion protein n=1 Tax=Nitrospirillum amazonense TaxID=28077 RepID=A0A560HJC5_9PROT|nr:efflux RND transporter periplasmic adaptor subunit [Nitrospirillum amazonense]TWB46585.1 multidrug efflux system membrane fusion protein [Nitrospirillum amazonense]
MTKRILAAAFFMAIVVLGLFSWRQLRMGPPGAMAFPPADVSAMTVEAHSVGSTLRAVGSLQAVQGVTLAPEQPGRVVAINFQAGQTVKAGTPLVQLYDGPERAGLADAEAKAEFARLQLDRSLGLASTGAEAKQVLQQRQSEFTQAKAAIAQYNAQIVQKTIVAPFDGEIGVRRANLGQYLHAGDPIATLTSLDSLYVNFTVPQQNLSALHVGGSVDVSSDAFPNQSFNGRITTIEPVIGDDTRNVTVQATISNADHSLRPGMYVTIGVVLPTRSAIVVPLTAVQTSASGDAVVVVRGSDAQHLGKAEFVPVKLGQQTGGDVIVEAGLKPGDVVVTVGQLRLQPGGAVKVTSLTPTAQP